MSAITPIITILLGYLGLGIFSYYISMPFYYIGVYFSTIISAFDWVSLNIAPIPDYVAVVWSILPFFVVFALFTKYFVTSSK